MVFNQGLVGPKAHPKGAADGQPVNIPALGYSFNALHSKYFQPIMDLGSWCESTKENFVAIREIETYMLSRKDALS